MIRSLSIETYLCQGIIELEYYISASRSCNLPTLLSDTQIDSCLMQGRMVCLGQAGLRSPSSQHFTFAPVPWVMHMKFT